MENRKSKVESRKSRPWLGRRGLSLAESVVSMALVSGLLVVSLNTLGASTLGRVNTANRQLGSVLAQGLMAEMLQYPYADPDDGSAGHFSFRAAKSLDLFATVGLDSGESAEPRDSFDDVDDFHGWSASPPQDRGGSPLQRTTGWRRSVAVAWVNLSAAGSLSPTGPTSGIDVGAKRIVVTVTYNNEPMAELVALRTLGLPPPTDGLKLLLVVNDVENLSVGETARRDLFGSWNFTVNLIDAGAGIAAFIAAFQYNHAAYVPEEVNEAVLGTTLVNASIGVVNEDPELADDFGFSQSIAYVTRSEIWIYDDTHYITKSFADTFYEMFSSAQPTHYMPAPWSNDLIDLGLTQQTPVLWVSSFSLLEAGASMQGGGTAAGRRVELPWGATGFDFNSLTDDAETWLKRSIEWAAGMEVVAVCGDGNCDDGEDSCSCTGDCGAPAAFEDPNLTCGDGLDNDCDGVTDCDDINCTSSVACIVAVCGNGLCESGEDCSTCSPDCDAKLTGNPSGWYCCGDGILQSAEGDASICDGNP